MLSRARIEGVPRRERRPPVQRGAVDRDQDLAPALLSPDRHRSGSVPRLPEDRRRDRIRSESVPHASVRTGNGPRILGIHDDPQTLRNLREALVPPVTPRS